MDETEATRTAYRYCEDLVRVHDKDQYLAGLFAPAQRRRGLYALYAFAFEIAQVRSRVSEPVTGAIRLQWWHDAVCGLRAEEAAANPVMLALADAARETGVPLDALTAAIEAREAELQGAPAAAAVAQTFVLAARFLGAASGDVAQAAEAAAQAVTLIASAPRQAREAYAGFLGAVEHVPEQALPAFLAVALVPLRLKHPDAPQWRRQIALLRAAWFGFPRV